MNLENLHCIVCSSKILKEVPFGYNFKNKWLQAFECKTCKMIFIFPQPNELELKELYLEDYFESGDYRCGHAKNCFDEDEETIVNHNLINKVCKIKSSGNFLDIGCAGGHFLNAIRKRGFNPFGVELSKYAAENAIEKFNLNIKIGDLFSSQFEKNFFDVIYLGDVLEHIPNPNDFLNEINRIAKNDCLVVILCPTQTNSILSRIGFLVFSLLNKKATVNLPPYHLLEFRPISMKNFLKKFNLKIIKCKSFTMKPNEIAQRNSSLQNVAKKIFQYPNYFFSSIFNAFGDRIEIFTKIVK